LHTGKKRIISAYGNHNGNRLDWDNNGVIPSIYFDHTLGFYMHLNVFILSLAQVFANSAPPVVTMVVGIISTDLAPYPFLATLPAAIMMVGIGLNSIPAALIMERIGRKSGFLLSFSLATIAIFIVAYSVWIKSFPLLCTSLFFVGGNMAFVSQFRFAAAESVSPKIVGKAISYVLLGGIFAAFLGPEIAKQAKDLIPDSPYVGSFISLGGLYLAGLIVLSFYRNINRPQQTESDSPRAIFEILKQPGVMLAITAGVVSYAVMVTIMMATPIQMHIKDGYAMGYVTLIIQGHMMGMFVPALFTGGLIQKFGIIKIMFAGVLCLLISIFSNIAGHQIENYAIGLVFLGIGWNFLFISGTTLLTEHYTFSERFKTQAANDFIVYTIMAMGSLSAGALIHYLGWVKLNLVMLPLLIVMIALLTAYTKWRSHGQYPPYKRP
jgi:MFS family permease